MAWTLKALARDPYPAPANDPFNWQPDADQARFLASRRYRCEMCGLRSRPHRDYRAGYLEILSLAQGDCVLCTLCMQSQHLGRAANGKRNHGLVIYCPTLCQGRLNQLALWAFVAKLSGNRFARAANQWIRTVASELVEPVASVIPGFSSGDVQEFAELYTGLSPRLRARERELFGDLRYWPNESVFEPQVRFWHAAAFRVDHDELDTPYPDEPATDGSNARRYDLAGDELTARERA